ncbi:hypothetical protein WHX56_22310 [Achromobacter veterisilvae]|uniref:Uncharacterized protein n=1 Tax=Achromobacter veterisilvae TaxID=2069367 RepID=A0ABZ2RV93_9BURK
MHDSLEGCGLQGATIVCWNLSQAFLAFDLDSFDAIIALADLGNSFDVIRTMRIAPMTKDAILRLAVAVLLPILPLALTMMSLEDLLEKRYQTTTPPELAISIPYTT